MANLTNDSAEGSLGTFEVGIVDQPHPFYDTRRALSAEIENTISEWLNIPITRRKLAAFAGPNDFIQLIADANGWQLFLLGAGAWAANTFGTEIMKLSAQEFWKNKGTYLKKIPMALTKVIQLLAQARERRLLTTAAVYIGSKEQRNTHRTHAALVIESADPEVVAWQLARFATCAPIIEQVYNSFPNVAQNGPGNADLSLRITMDEFGLISIERKLELINPTTKVRFKLVQITTIGNDDN